jgi:hypothetical protein
MLWNSDLMDQGAPPLTARSACHVGNMGCNHRGAAGCCSARGRLAGWPARRSPLARVGSATSGGVGDPSSCNITSSDPVTLHHRAKPSCLVIV